MNDRELIGQAIAAHICNDPETLTMEQSHLIEGLSDAVLAAIGDRLLSEMPEWVRLVHVTLEGGEDRNPETVPWADFARCTDGYGETPVAAIRNALEGA